MRIAAQRAAVQRAAAQRAADHPGPRDVQWNYTRLGTEHVVARSRKLFTFVAKELELMLGTQKSRCAQIFMTRAWVWHFHLTRIFSCQKSPRDVRTLDISADFLQKLRSSNIKHKGNPLEINENQDIHDIVETEPFYFMFNKMKRFWSGLSSKPIKSYGHLKFHAYRPTFRHVPLLCGSSRWVQSIRLVKLSGISYSYEFTRDIRRKC